MAHERPLAGVLLVDKPCGRSSASVGRYLHKLLRQYDRIKVGHLGTLDPMASGLLVLLVGKATRYADYVDSQPKRYVANISLGVATDTDDATGSVILRKDTSVQNLEQVLDSFVGQTEQIVPRYSAVKYQGVRGYKLARGEKDFEPKRRQVRLHSVNVLQANHLMVKIDILVDSGYYVRSLARDLGERLGGCAHLAKLKRTAIGPWSIDETLFVNDLPKLVDDEKLVGSLLQRNLLTGLLKYPSYQITAEQLQLLGYGQQIAAQRKDGIYRISCGFAEQSKNCESFAGLGIICNNQMKGRQLLCND